MILAVGFASFAVWVFFIYDNKKYKRERNSPFVYLQVIFKLLFFACILKHIFDLGIASNSTERIIAVVVCKLGADLVEQILTRVMPE